MAKFNRFKHFTNTSVELFKKSHKLKVGKYTASMIPNCIGYGDSSPKKMQMEIKSGVQSPTNDFTQRARDFGKLNEPTAILQTIQMYSAYTGRKWELVKPGIVFHPTFEGKLGATPDAVITDGKEFVNVEVKCSYYLSLKERAEVEQMDRFDLYENNRHKWVIQALTQMECLPLEKTLFGIWTAHKSWIMEIPRNKDLFGLIWAELMTFEQKIKDDVEIKTWRKDVALQQSLGGFMRSKIRYISNPEGVDSE